MKNSFKTIAFSLLGNGSGWVPPMGKTGYRAARIPCACGAILPGENVFKLRYLLAFVLISAGILLGNRSEVKK